MSRMIWFLMHILLLNSCKHLVLGVGTTDDTAGQHCENVDEEESNILVQEIDFLQFKHILMNHP